MGTACAFCDGSTNVQSGSYMVHIRFVLYTSVTRTLVGRSLSVTCSVPMRSLRLPRGHSPPLRRLPSPDKHLLLFFCPFGVHYLYPLMCDSTIYQHATFLPHDCIQLNLLITLRHVEISMIKVGKHTWYLLNLSNFTLNIYSMLCTC